MISRKLFQKKSIAAMCIAAASLILPATITADVEGRWVFHPAFSNTSNAKEAQLHKIIDGNRYVYFCVRGGNYNSSQAYYYSTFYNTDPLQLFRYDKSREWTRDNIDNLADVGTIKNSFPTVMEYSPRLGVLAVVYENRAIDLIYDDGRIVYSNALKDVSNPKNLTVPHSITFDSDLPVMYLATTFGYLQINISNGELSKSVKLNKKVAYAARMGNDMIVIAGDNVSNKEYSATTYRFPADTPPSYLEGNEIKLATAIPSVTMGTDNTLANLQALMPLTDNSFTAIAPSTADTYFYLILVTLGEEGVKGELLSQRDTFDNAASSNYRHLFRTDGFWQPTKDGYMISGQSGLYMIKKGVDIDYASQNPLDNFKNEAFSTISKANLEATEKAVKVGSFDGKRLWAFTYETQETNVGSPIVDRGFYYRDISDEGAFGNKSDIVEFNAPTMAIAADIEWNPKHGMLFRGPGSRLTDRANSDGNGMIASYKDGVWTDLSCYKNYPKLWKLEDGLRDIDVDPLNPDWIWGNAPFGGMLRQDIGDYSNMMMYGTTPRSKAAPYNTIPYLPAFEEYVGYTLISAFSNASFDIDDNMWFVYFKWYVNDYDSDLYHETYTHLHLLTKEDRLKMDKINSKDDIIVPKLYKIPYNSSYYQGSKVLALTAPGNENLIMHSPATYVGFSSACLIFDHNGTLDDTSDDRHVKIEDMRDEEGDVMHYYYEISIYEDPFNGEVWLNTQRGPLIIQPREVLAGSKRFRRPKYSVADGSIKDFIFDNVEINKIVNDLQGRKWIATLCDGVIVLAADNRRLLAHFTTDNSPLLSNYVPAIGCDKNTGAIFIGTDKGMVEFQPGDIGDWEVPAGRHLSIYPSAVTPDYNGYVNISGAVGGAEYVVEDAEGTVVCNLGTASSSRIQWDGRDDNGNKVSAGRYNIKRSGKEEKHTVTVLR